MPAGSRRYKIRSAAILAAQCRREAGATKSMLTEDALRSARDQGDVRRKYPPKAAR
jgi:hypothetical protein